MTRNGTVSQSDDKNNANLILFILCILWKIIDFLVWAVNFWISVVVPLKDYISYKWPVTY